MDAAVTRNPANFGSKSCLLVSYSPNRSSVPNLKLLVSTVAEISRGFINVESSFESSFELLELYTR